MGDVLDGLVSSLTGNINKAYILVHKPGTDKRDKSSASIGKATALAPGMAALKGAADGGIKNNFGVNKDLISAAGSLNYIPIRVQFNPSTLSFQSQGGRIYKQSVGGAGENMFQQMDVPSETTMSAELYFDDFNIMDAFMMDAFDVFSVGGMVQKGKQLVSAGKGMKFSVRDISELFVAAMIQNYTRIVGFVWNKTMFWGELTGVNCQFTMFNKAGEPIRSKVTIEIRQDQAIAPSSGKVNPYATEKQWDNAFNDMFKADMGTGLLGQDNQLSNLLNL